MFFRNFFEFFVDFHHAECMLVSKITFIEGSPLQRARNFIAINFKSDVMQDESRCVGRL